MGARGRAAKQAGKAFERWVAAELGGERYPADTGGEVDVKVDGAVLQCKNVSRVNYREIEDEAERIDAAAWEKGHDGSERRIVGAVIVKRRAGAGRTAPVLAVMTLSMFNEILRRVNR